MSPEHGYAHSGAGPDGLPGSAKTGLARRGQPPRLCAMPAVAAVALLSGEHNPHQRPDPPPSFVTGLFNMSPASGFAEAELSGLGLAAFANLLGAGTIWVDLV